MLDALPHATLHSSDALPSARLSEFVCTHIQTLAHTDTDTHTDTQTKTDTHTHTHGHAHGHIDTHTATNRQASCEWLCSGIQTDTVEPRG